MERISFDFDGVLTTEKGRELARVKIKQGFEVWIITARQMNQNDRVYEVAKELGIRKNNVVFTNGRDKWSFVELHNISTHYDNNVEQITKIKKNTKAKGQLFA
jgi:uncharacterized HAD superfamily protein